MNISFLEFLKKTAPRQIANFLIGVLVLVIAMIVFVEWMQGPVSTHNISGYVVGVQYSFPGTDQQGVDKSILIVDIDPYFLDNCKLKTDTCDKSWQMTNFSFANDGLDKKVELGTLLDIECVTGPYEINPFKVVDRVICRITNINKLQP